MNPTVGRSNASPLIIDGLVQYLRLMLLEFVAWGVAVMAATAGGTAAAMAFSGWALDSNRVPPVAGLFVAWLIERTRSNLGTLGLVLVLTSINIAREDRNNLFRLLTWIPIALVFGLLALQAYRYARAFRDQRRIERGSPYVLYLRPSMADHGSFGRFEANLVSVLRPIGPTVMLSDTRLLRRSGVVRYHWRLWQERIADLIQNASIVVFFMMPRRGDDKPGEDLFWEEFEQDAVRRLLPSGKIVLFFREGWANRCLPCINSNGTVRIGDTSLMAEVHRILKDEVSAKWPEELRRARFLWFSPGAKPQSLGEFNESLGSRRRLLAELGPVLDYCGVRPKRDWPRIFLSASLLGLMLWIGNLPAPSGLAFAADWPRWIKFAVPLAIWLWLVLKGVRKLKREYYGWNDYDYDNFVLHRKYRFKDGKP